MAFALVAGLSAFMRQRTGGYDRVQASRDGGTGRRATAHRIVRDHVRRGRTGRRPRRCRCDRARAGHGRERRHAHRGRRVTRIHAGGRGGRQDLLPPRRSHRGLLHRFYYDVSESTTPDPQSDVPAEADTVTDSADSSTEAEVADVDAAASPSACSDGAYKTDDRKEYGTYNWYIGDGGLPAGLSKNDAIYVFMDALDNITDSYNNCGYSDSVGAKENYLATTSREASVNKSSQCTGQDGLSVWDSRRHQGHRRRHDLFVHLVDAGGEERPA